MAIEVVVGETGRHLLGVRDQRSHLHGEIGVVLARKHFMRELIECLSDAAGMILANTENDAFADLPAQWIA